MSEKEKISGEKLAENVKYLSDFDKGYFLGKAEARAEQRKEEAQKEKEVKEDGQPAHHEA